MPAVQGAVYIGGVQVGTASGSVEDEAAEGYRLYKVKEYPVLVYAGGARVGLGELVIEDAVAAGQGGQETDKATGAVTVGGVQVGTATFTVTESYAAETGVMYMVRYTARIVARPGEPITVTVDLVNSGQADASYTVELLDGAGAVVDSATVTVPAGGTATATLQAPAINTPGTYTYTVRVRPA